MFQLLILLVQSPVKDDQLAVVSFLQLVVQQHSSHVAAITCQGVVDLFGHLIRSDFERVQVIRSLYLSCLSCLSCLNYGSTTQYSVASGHAAQHSIE